ncbi:hypothetical protein BC332_31814 [Capsicum chinense]|nr:hypothetical protein BC332_31814 [Capsicum chinense]
MDCVKLVLFCMLYPFLCQRAFSSSLPYFCPKHQALALLQFKHMFIINPNASDYCSPLNPSTLSWNKSKDCCSWDGVHCEKTTGQVIELDLFQLSNHRLLISPKFGELSSLTDLDLLRSGFTGVIPAEISHLSKLQVLSISSDDPYGLRLGSYSFELLLKNLTQLRELDLDTVNISSTNPIMNLNKMEVRSVLQEEMQSNSTSIDAPEILDAINITSVQESTYVDSNTEVADMVKSHFDSEFPVLGVGDKIPQYIFPDVLSSASIDATKLKFSPLSFSVKGPLEFDCKVFDRVPKRDIFAEFHSPSAPIVSLPPVLSINDCKWVDTGQLSDSFDRHQYNQIKLLGCAPFLINPLSSSSDAPKLFDKLAERSRWLSMFHHSEYIGEVEVLIECSDNLTSFCNSYKLLGITLENSFLYSLDRAATSRVERYTIDQFRHVRANCKRDISVERYLFENANVFSGNFRSYIYPLSDNMARTTTLSLLIELCSSEQVEPGLPLRLPFDFRYKIGNFTWQINLELVISQHARILEWIDSLKVWTSLSPQQEQVEGISMLVGQIEGLSTMIMTHAWNARVHEGPKQVYYDYSSSSSCYFCDPYGTQTWRKPLETTDAEEKEKQYSVIGSKDVLTHHHRCHVSQYKFHFCKAEIFVENYSRSWNHFSSFMCTCNWWHIKLSYLEKTWMQLLWLLNDAFPWISSKLVLKVPIRWGASWITEILHVLMPPIQTALEESDPTINSDLNSKLHQVFNVCPLVLPSSLSKELFGDYLVRCGCILWFEKQKEGSMLEVALDNEAFEGFFWVVNTDKEEHNNTMVSVQLYSNLEDKVLIEGGRIVMNLTKMELREVFPERVFHLSNLQYLYLSSNSLTGPIPSNISGLQNLQYLDLSSNYLNGTIPSCIFSLPSLEYFDLSNNSFSGKIQEFKSKTLFYVILKQNQLQGPIPKSLLDQKDLEILILSQNNFNGQIASAIYNLKTLMLLDLGRNHLNRTIPHCLGEMSVDT